MQATGAAVKAGENRVMGVARVASAMGVSIKTVRRWIHAGPENGGLRAVNVGSERHPIYRVFSYDLATFSALRADRATTQNRDPKIVWPDGD